MCKANLVITLNTRHLKNCKAVWLLIILKNLFNGLLTKKKSHPNFFSEPFSKHTGITFRSPPCFYPLNYTSQNSDFYENVQNPYRRRVNHTEFYQPQPFLIIWKSRLGNGYVVCCHFFCATIFLLDRISEGGG